jgi:hypothetical protein
MKGQINSTYFYKQPKQDKNNNPSLNFTNLFSSNSKYKFDKRTPSTYNSIYYCHKNALEREIFGIVRIKSNEYMPRFQFAYDSDEFTKEELDAEREQKMRTPDQDIINKMIEDYNKATDLSLYELADRYDLCINNLFRLLKENKIIEKETDAKGYGDFYRDYLGSGHVWNGVSNELGLIKDFYNHFKFNL